LGCLDLSLGGGEPLVRADLSEIIRYASSRGVNVRISTNAAAATPEAVEPLKGLRIALIKVSMEGVTDTVYDLIRGEAGAFRQVLQGIENLKTLKVPIFLHRAFMKPNVSELSQLVRLAEELQVFKLVLDTVMPVGRAAENPDLLLDRDETAHLFDEALAMQEHTKVRIEIPHRVPPHKPLGKVLFGGFGCRCGILRCHIDARGSVSPTGFLKDMCPGNLRQQSFKQIWDSGASLVQFRRPTGNTQCATCSCFAECRGGCRARALLMGYDVNMPDGNCVLAYPQIRRQNGRKRVNETGLSMGCAGACSLAILSFPKKKTACF
jgi:radical SAM protein with 4Fe4S-binding SPASM domain